MQWDKGTVLLCYCICTAYTYIEIIGKNKAFSYIQIEKLEEKNQWTKHNKLNHDK